MDLQAADCQQHQSIGFYTSKYQGIILTETFESLTVQHLKRDACIFKIIDRRGLNLGSPYNMVHIV